MYLMIRNPGVADYRGFTLLGVSTTRNAGFAGTIGQFGSGSKYAIALLLRSGINPVIVCGNLKMTFFIKEECVKGQVFRRVCVKYSGKDVDGTTKSSTEDLGFTLEWGMQDWKNVNMAFREFVANANDGAITAGGSFKGVEFEWVNEPRAKFGYTAIFLPDCDAVQKMYASKDLMFLHWKSPELLKAKCLPKRFPNDDKVLIYKNGVLVNHCPGKSVFDYNLGDELTLDESRNANEWDVRYAVSQGLRNESPDNLATIIKGVINNPDCWEAKLDSSYLSNNSYADPATQTKRKTAFKEAWEKVAGPKGVVTTGSVALSSFVQEKGFTPVTLPESWGKALESYDVPTETKVLSRNELDGKILSEPTEDMINCTKKVWTLLEAFNLTNNKPMPNVKGFMSVMDGSSQTLGYFIPGGDTIYLHTSLGQGKMMFKVALEEIVHYTTGSDDKSRDIQDFLFNLVTEMAF